jgi:hypothetical protein
MDLPLDDALRVGFITGFGSLDGVRDTAARSPSREG